MSCFSRRLVARSCGGLDPPAGERLQRLLVGLVEVPERPAQVFLRLGEQPDGVFALLLADFAKRESKFAEAKLLFKLITHIQPYAYQGWLEYAKMQEECGRNDSARAILQEGLRFNQLNDNLFVKAIKVEERARRFESVRSQLGGLRDEKFERAWRMVLEGALFEGRCGNKEAARKAFRYLLRNCQSYGPIYLEASKYEEREGEIDKAIEVCEEGLQYNSKYGPLWF